jgi:O-antigen/teichoic acid export membrane protein
MSKAIRHAPHKILKIFQTALCLSLMPAIGISLIFYFGAGIFVKSFFSSSWGDVSIILRYFSVLVAFRLIASCISRVFAILEHQKIAFLWNVLRLLSVFLVFFSGKTFSFSFKESIYILCLVLSINDCLVIFLAYRVVLERSRRERYKLDRKFQVDMT